MMMSITEKMEKTPVEIWSRDIELACRSIVNQLVSSIPKDVLLRTSYVECRQSIATQNAQEVNVELKPSVTKRVQFTDTKEECSSGDETLSGESFTLGPGVNNLSGRQCRNDQGTEFSGESRDIMKKSEDDDVESIGPNDDSQSQLSQP